MTIRQRVREAIARRPGQTIPEREEVILLRHPGIRAAAIRRQEVLRAVGIAVIRLREAAVRTTTAEPEAVPDQDPAAVREEAGRAERLNFLPGFKNCLP